MDDKIRAALIKDALYNLHPHSGPNTHYSKGVLVGLVTGIMACGISFEDAISICKKYLPDKIKEGTIPPSWEQLLTQE